MTRFNLGLSNGVGKPCKDVKKPTAAMAPSTAATDPDLLARSERKSSRWSASAGREDHPRSDANFCHLYQLRSYLRCDPTAMLLLAYQSPGRTLGNTMAVRISASRDATALVTSTFDGMGASSVARIVAILANNVALSGTNRCFTPGKRAQRCLTSVIGRDPVATDPVVRQSPSAPSR
jgi:hypothetical protein